MFVQLDFFNIISVLKTKKIDEIYNKFIVIFFLGIMMDVLMGVHVPSNVPMEFTPFKGMEFEANRIAYDFYNEYGRNVGFSTRKEYLNKCKKTRMVTSRIFVYAKEGVRGKDKRDQNIKKP